MSLVKTVPFQGTKEQEEKLLEMIRAHKGQKGALMPVLQQAQDIYGYLPIEVQKIISDEMEIPMEKIYGVATFYAQFALQPKGKYRISVCLGTACYVKGSGKSTRSFRKLCRSRAANVRWTENFHLRPAGVSALAALLPL